MTQPFTKTSQNAADLYTWADLTTSDVGEAIVDTTLGDKTVQVSGTFNSATVVIQGSNDGSNWLTLVDGFNGALSFTVAGMATIHERPRFIRPSVSGGSSPSVTVTIQAARSIR